VQSRDHLALISCAAVLPDDLEEHAKAWQCPFIIADGIDDNIRKFFTGFVLYTLNDGLPEIEIVQANPSNALIFAVNMSSAPSFHPLSGLRTYRTGYGIISKEMIN